ncbi:hypothetical protein [Tabrizicola sp. BL-A-41-H6]|uniref:hypothetical protein n=1 Tax=Tabrizicola sp. BL-A-41-H6 TaxID=3421107 RepID=UPI003D66A5B2
MARLRALQAPATFAPGALRVIGGPGMASPLAALLREINETLLGRSLVFSTDAGATLSLDVAGRRVLRVTAASGIAGAEACLGVPALDDANREDLAGVFSALTASGSTLRVIAAPLGRSEGLSVGLPVARLADHLGIDLNDEGADSVEAEAEAEAVESVGDGVEPEAEAGPETVGFLQAFVAQMGDGLAAWLIRSGDEEQGRFGPEEMVAPLEDFLNDEADALMQQLDRLTQAAGEPVCTVLGNDLVSGHSILCLQAEGAVLLGVVAGDAAGQVLAAWNAARG